MNISASKNSYKLSRAERPLAVDFTLSDFLEPGTNSNEIQTKLEKLNVSGKIEETLENWQNFTEKYSASPLFPYCVFIISQLYQSSSQLIGPVNKEESESLIALSRELSWGLSQTNGAPDYLKIFAQNAKANEVLFLGDGKEFGQLRL